MGPSPHAVSVVIPLFNRAQLVRHTLESLSARHHPGIELEIIVVDDGSTDRGPEVAERLLENGRVLRQSRRGAPQSRNTGIAAATHGYLFLLDSDDLVEPGFFLPRIEALEENERAAAAYGPVDFFSGDGAFDDSLVLPRHEPYPVELRVERDTHLRRLLSGWYIPPPALLWRTAVVRTLGGHTPSLKVNQDVDLLFRALVTGWGLVGCDGPRGLYRDHATPGRQGVIAGDISKATDLLELRRRFAAELDAAGLLCEENREVLARFCLDRWMELRDTHRSIADEFLALSRHLYPHLEVRGGRGLRALGALVGAPGAMQVRQLVTRWRERLS